MKALEAMARKFDRMARRNQIHVEIQEPVAGRRGTRIEDLEVRKQKGREFRDKCLAVSRVKEKEARDG